MQEKSVLIRADGSPSLGMGHISRCLALAQTCLNQDTKVIFACRDALPEVRNLIISGGFQVLNVEAATHEIHAEALAIAELANRNNVQWLIVDHPSIMFEHETLIKQHCSSEIIVFDGQLRKHQCDVLVNPNAFATMDNCRDTVPAECQILAGYQYFVLNDAYLKTRTPSCESQDTDKQEHILITLGGSDPENCTLKICHALAAADFGEHEPVFDIVVGPANPHRQSIEDFLLEADSVNFVMHVSPENLVSLLQGCMICISAGGITLGEAAYLGKSVIGVAILNNQRRTIESLADMGALQVSDAHHIASHCEELLTDAEKRKQLQSCASALVDGFGKQRIANRLWNSSWSEG